MDQLAQLQGNTRATPYTFGDTFAQSLGALVGVNQAAYQQSEQYRKEQFQQKLDEYNARRQAVMDRATAAIQAGQSQGDINAINWGLQQLQGIGAPPAMQQIPPQQTFLDRMLGPRPTPPAPPTPTAGLVTPGTINPMGRPAVQNADGSTSTIRTITISENGKTILLPTVIGGRVVSNEEAIQHYHQTGEHLGVFDSEANAGAYDRALHDRIEPGSYDRMPQISGGGTLMDRIKLLPPATQDRAVQAVRGMGIDPALPMTQILRQHPGVNIDGILQRASTPITRAGEYDPRLKGTNVGNLPIERDPITGEYDPASVAAVYNAFASSGGVLTDQQKLAQKAAQAGYWKTQIIGAGGTANPAMRMQMRAQNLNDNEIKAIEVDAKTTLNQMKIDEIVQTPYGPMRQGDYSGLKAQLDRDKQARIERQQELAAARAEKANDATLSFLDGLNSTIISKEAEWNAIAAQQNGLLARATQLEDRAAGTGFGPQPKGATLGSTGFRPEDPDQAKADRAQAELLKKQAEALDGDLDRARGIVEALKNRWEEAKKARHAGPPAPTPSPGYQWVPVR